ncbi:superfamily II DNA/RNA helicase [Nocardioides massiliensis]|uniref:RNA helicase n=1 Tax=Nocardioides massiliensis TaxID=1325935 RepID=A0ABT9NV02_9ACTN|nr:superfamily II DNA/RNA helicase [Nocardioides massiliensis]
MHPEIADALERAGIVTPFPIQEMTLSVALQGTDLIGQARTGTGKTLAFGIPLLQRTVPPTSPAYADHPTPGKPQALIVAPTRELALQVSNDMSVASKDFGSRVLTVYGGVGYEPQLDALEAGVDVVVGTPGRLLDLANRGALDLSHVQAVVLDEADEMLDLGFLPDVERLLAKTPSSRQTMLFSATMPSAIVALARTHMRHPMNIRAESSTDNQTVPATAQFIYQAHDLDKTEIIGRLLQSEGADKFIVFCRTKRQAQRVADDLAERGFPSSPLHGDMQQTARERALAKFREDKLKVLVATDVAARGIDVSGVSHVVNYTCPEDEKTYVHRIGRTGRAGATGTAITFVDWADLARWKMINKALDLPFDEPVETYSTSEHLFTDQGIPAGTKGRVVPETPPEPKARREGGRDGGHSGGSGGAGGSGDQPRRSRNRSRSRTRSGQPVEGEGASTASQGEAHGGDAAASSAASSNGAEGSGAPRRRRRRRSGGGESAPQESAAASE